MPSELLHQILRGLPVRFIVRLMRTCKTLVPPAQIVDLLGGCRTAASLADVANGVPPDATDVRSHLQSLQTFEQRGHRELELLGPMGLWTFACTIKSLGVPTGSRCLDEP